MSPLHFKERWPKLINEFDIHKIGIAGNKFPSDKKYIYLEEMIKEVNLIGGVLPAVVTYLGFKQKPLGVIFRSLIDKKFHMHYFVSSKLVFYSSESFENNIEKFYYGMPIVLLEGILDVEAFVYMTKYPFVLGYLTSNVSFSLAGILSSLTDNILVIHDNDEAGKKGIGRSKYYFEKFNIKINVCSTMESDFAAVYENDNDIDVLKARSFLDILR